MPEKQNPASYKKRLMLTCFLPAAVIALAVFLQVGLLFSPGTPTPDENVSYNAFAVEEMAPGAANEEKAAVPKPFLYGSVALDVLIVLLGLMLASQLLNAKRRLEKENENRALALQALQDSEARFQSAFQKAYNGMGIASTDGQWLEVNIPFARMLGYSKQEMTGMHYTVHTHPEDLAQDRRYEKQLLQGEINTFAYEKRFINKSGQTIWVFISGSLVLDTNKKPQYYVVEVQDITEQKLTRNALHDSEQRFRSVVEAANDAIICGDSDGRIILWNEWAEKMFGYSEDEAIGKPLTLVIPEEYRAAHQRGIRRLQEGGMPKLLGKTIVLSGLRKGGIHFPLELSLSSWKNDGQSFYTGIIRDISERRRFEEDLLTMQEVFENALEGISQLNVQGNFITTNHAFADMFGYEPHELMNRHWTELIHPDDEQYVLKCFRHLFNNNKLDLEARGLKKTGEPFHFSMVMIKHFNNEKKFSGYYCFTKDITYRKVSEQSLISSEQRFRSLVESAKDAIVSADENGNIIFWNHSAEEIFGYKEDEVLGMPIASIVVPPRYRDAHQKGIQRLKEGGRSRIIGKTLALSALRKNGEEFPIELSLSFWCANGRNFYNGIIRDVSQRGEVERLTRGEEIKSAALEENSNIAE